MLAAALPAFAPAHAIDPGVAKGQLEIEGRTIALTHAYAHQHDNAEGLLDSRELRIVLADREIAPTLLAGIHMATLDEMARKGGVQGVLLTVDPARPSAALRGVLLMAGPNPAKSLVTFSRGGGDAGFAKLNVGENRVQGEARHASADTHPAFAYAASFSAPLFREEPISVRYSGAEALASAPFKALAAYRGALAAGDLEGARRLATPGSLREVDALVAQAGEAEARKVLREMSALPVAGDKPQVFVRGARATIVYQAGEGRVLQSMLRAGGLWLVD